MTDKMTPQQRHFCMSQIRSVNTRPEKIVRKYLWKNGFRFRLHDKRLPGKPDIVMPKYRTVIFINGCFWHGHKTKTDSSGNIIGSDCCRKPTTNTEFWETKIKRNIERDKINLSELEKMGWNVIIIWECELKPKVREDTLNNLIKKFRPVDYDFHPQEILVAAEDETDIYKPN